MALEKEAERVHQPRVEQHGDGTEQRMDEIRVLSFNLMPINYSGLHHYRADQPPPPTPPPASGEGRLIRRE